MSFPSEENVGLVDNFVSKLHSEVPTNLDPRSVSFSNPYHVLVLGASRGIGAGIARAYIKAGASTVILSSTRVKGLREVQDECRTLNPAATVEVIPCDISSADAVSALASAIQASCGYLNTVVVNSGFSGPVVLDIVQGQPTDFQRVTDINYVGTYHAAHFLLPLLLDERSEFGGRAFIAVGSLAGLLVTGPIANFGYCVSKFAQSKLLEHIAAQYGSETKGGLLALSCHPGAVLTEMADLTTPDVFRPALVDSVDLCGAFCVWLSQDPPERRSWLNGRLVSATWDVEELVRSKDDIVKRDLLKYKCVV